MSWPCAIKHKVITKCFGSRAPVWFLSVVTSKKAQMFGFQFAVVWSWSKYPPEVHSRYFTAEISSRSTMWTSRRTTPSSPSSSGSAAASTQRFTQDMVSDAFLACFLCARAHTHTHTHTHRRAKSASIEWFLSPRHSTEPTALCNRSGGVLHVWGGNQPFVFHQISLLTQTFVACLLEQFVLQAQYMMFGAAGSLIFDHLLFWSISVDKLSIVVSAFCVAVMKLTAIILHGKRSIIAEISMCSKDFELDSVKCYCCYNKKQCSSQLQCEVPSCICFISIGS